MKKMRSLLAGIVMALAVFLLPQVVLAAETVPITVVEDITDVQNVSSTNYAVGTGEYSNIVQFTLAKPAYVYVSAYSTVMKGNWTELGKIDDFAVYSDANCSNLVTNDSNMYVSGNSKVSKYLCLDAGTYWIYFAKEKNDSSNASSSGEFRLSVAAQYLDVTAAKNGSWQRAQNISTDKTVTGFLSGSTRTSWFKFTVADGTTAKITASLENPLGESVFPSSKTGVTLYRANHKIIEGFNIADHYYESSASDTLTLTKGTYYIGVTGDTSYSIWDETKLVKNDRRNMGVVNLKITTIKKAAISKFTNVKGKKAQITFKAVSGADGYEIQYSTSKNFTKGVKTLTAGAKAKKVTITKLTKGKKYYVRVRAFKYDEDGNKITGSWSDVKNKKITK